MCVCLHALTIQSEGDLSEGGGGGSDGNEESSTSEEEEAPAEAETSGPVRFLALRCLFILGM